MKQAFALFFSYVFHPLWMPLLVFSLAWWLDPLLLNIDQHFQLVLVILIINTVAPGLSFLVMRRTGMISSADIRDRSERTLPFLLILLYFVLSYVVLRNKLIVPEPVMLSLFTALIVAVVVSFLITLRWKISIHSMAAGSLVGTLTALNSLHSLSIWPYIMGALLIAGCVATSRLILKAHTPMQTYMGFLLGWSVHHILILSGVWF